MTSPDPAGLPTPPQGFPQPPYPAPPGRGRGWGPAIAGLVVGLVLGGGGVAIAWVLAGGSSTGTAADGEAICGIIERTPDPGKIEDLSLEYLRRWSSASELASAIGEQDSRYKPLADTLDELANAIRQFDEPQIRESAQRARQQCADL